MCSTLAVAFFVGTALSLLALAVAGRVGAAHLLLTLEILPALLLRLLGVGFVGGLLLDRRWLRPASPMFAAVCGLTGVLLGIVG